MDVILPIIMFLVGCAVGCAAIWFLLKNQISGVRQQERNVALADVRVAQEKAAGHENRLAELRAAISQTEQKLGQRDEEITELKQQHIMLQTCLKKDQEKFQEKIELLNTAEKQ